MNLGQPSPFLYLDVLRARLICESENTTGFSKTELNQNIRIPKYMAIWPQNKCGGTKTVTYYNPEICQSSTKSHPLWSLWYSVTLLYQTSI